MAGDRDSFPRRWSRLKRGGGAAQAVAPRDVDTPPANAAEIPADRQPAPAPSSADGGSETPPQTTAEVGRDAPAREPPADLPDVDTLGADSDYSAFLGEGVPENVARRAMRKLWRSDPMFAHLDGLNDYDENFRAYFANAIASTVKTIYRAAKGSGGGGAAREPAAAETDGEVSAAAPPVTDNGTDIGTDIGAGDRADTGDGDQSGQRLHR